MSAILRGSMGRPFEFLDLHTLRNCVTLSLATERKNRTNGTTRGKYLTIQIHSINGSYTSMGNSTLNFLSETISRIDFQRAGGKEEQISSFENFYRTELHEKNKTKYKNLKYGKKKVNLEICNLEDLEEIIAGPCIYS